MKEQDVTKAIVDYINSKGFYALRLNSGKIMQTYGDKTRLIHLCPQGTPDVMAIVNGKPYFFEVKKDEKIRNQWLKKIQKYRETSYAAISAQKEVMQYKTMKLIEKNGGDCYLVCSLDEVRRIIAGQNIL